jgi:hypothetical protein
MRHLLFTDLIDQSGRSEISHPVTLVNQTAMRVETASLGNELNHSYTTWKKEGEGGLGGREERKR